VRLKFECESNDRVEGGAGREVVLRAVTGGSEENKRFWRYTPAGELRFTTEVERSLGLFEPGVEYVVDIRRAN
jgi:hypothetical protein